MQEGGALAVAPEWRNSLHLKWHELWAKAQAGDEARGHTIKTMDGLLKMPFLDILDESDELLHHRCDWMIPCCQDALWCDLAVAMNAMHFTPTQCHDTVR